MRFLISSLFLVAACSKGTPPAEPAKPEEPKKPVTVETTAPETAPATTAPATKEPEAKPEPVAAQEVYLVWTPTADGNKTVWLAGDAAAAERPEAMVWAGGSLWAIEYRYFGYRDVACEAFFAEEDGGKPWRDAAPGPTKYLPWVVAKALVGKDAGKEVVLVDKKSDYVFEEKPDAKGVIPVLGDHNGRTVSLSGGAGELLLVTACEGAYACGAHGDYGCSFMAVPLGGSAVTFDMRAAEAALAADTKATLDLWVEEGEGEVNRPALAAFEVKANKGKPLVEYRYVADVPYSGSDGGWDAYTQSRTHLAKPVPGLGLAETPAPVLAWLEANQVDDAFGWSLVPADQVAAVRAAFDDRSTLPAPKPADEVAPSAAVDAGALVDQGRKATREKRYPEAVALFTQAVEADPKRARAYSGRGYAHLLAGDRASAKKDFETALTLEDDAKFQASIYFNLGELNEQDNDPAAALAAYVKADSLSPSDAAKKRIAKLSK